MLRVIYRPESFWNPSGSSKERLEYWHEKLEEGVNYLYADRETLIDVVDSLRKQPERATSVAQNASEFVSTYLSPNSAQKSFNEAWLNRTH